MSSLDVLRRQTGVSSGPELADAVARMKIADVDALAEALLDEPPFPAGEVPSDERWPVVNARASTLSRGAQGFADAPGPAGLNIMSAMSPRDLGRATFSDSVLRALLYGHGLVFEDPLLLAAELHVGTPADTRELSRRFMEAAVVSLVEIDLLVDERIVQTFFVSAAERRAGSAIERHMAAELADRPADRDELWDAFEAAYVEGLGPSLRELWRRIRAGDRNPPLALIDQALTETDAQVIRTFVDVVASLRPQHVIDNTIAVVASVLDDRERLGGHHDVLCGSALFARLLFLGDPDPVARLRVEQLAETPVPNIAELDVADVVGIRRQSDAFELWRSRLSRGLAYAHELRAEHGPSVDLAATSTRSLPRGVTSWSTRRDPRPHWERPASSPS